MARSEYTVGVLGYIVAVALCYAQQSATHQFGIRLLYRIGIDGQICGQFPQGWDLVARTIHARAYFPFHGKNDLLIHGNTVKTVDGKHKVSFLYQLYYVK